LLAKQKESIREKTGGEIAKESESESKKGTNLSLKLAKPKKCIRGKTGNEIAKESESESKKDANLSVPDSGSDSDSSARLVRIIRAVLPGGKLPLDRKPERVKGGYWGTRSITKRKLRMLVLLDREVDIAYFCVNVDLSYSIPFL
jgi:hypothetical protein